MRDVFAMNAPKMPPGQEFGRGGIHTSAALPCSYVRHLVIDNRKHRCLHYELEDMIIGLRRTLVGLLTFVYDGPLSRSSNLDDLVR